MANEQHIFVGVAAPVSAPADHGHHYVDTVAKVMYFSVGTSSVADWVTYGGVPTGTANTVAGYDSSGDLYTLPGWGINSTSGGLNLVLVQEPNNGGGGSSINTETYNVEPLQNSPNESYVARSITVNLDNNNSGFNLGFSGTGFRMFTLDASHQGSGNVGDISFFTFNYNLGNGTDPISINGISYIYGFGSINANTTITGQIQGYGFQPSAHASSVINTSVTAFYDFSTIASTGGVNSYTSFSAGPVIANIKNNGNYTGLNLNPTITSFTGNASVNFISLAGTFGDMSLTNAGANLLNVSSTFGDMNYFGGINLVPNIAELNSFNGLYINPNVTLLNQSAYGVYVNVSNITGYAGTQSTLTIQDLTYTFNAAGDNNVYTIEYTGGGTAGSEVVSLAGTDITIQIESGVSTATQIKAAVDGTMGINTAITVTISGVGSNTQVTDGPDNFVSGTNPGTIKAAEFVGDVNIQGDLSFTGALSIGQINAYATLPLSDGGGTPSSVHSLITAPTAAANATIANADMLGVNTAALINIGANATITTAFLGVAALGLPAVVTLGAGATVDRVSGAAFAISLDGAAGGGTINEVALCRALGLPNGITTVNRLYGYEVSLPFGAVGTDQWGLWVSADIENYMAGSLLIGGTAVSDDSVTNSSVGFEIKSTTKALLNARMTTTERNALTGVNGMQIYNTTTDKLQVYAAGSWVDLH